MTEPRYLNLETIRLAYDGKKPGRLTKWVTTAFRGKVPGRLARCYERQRGAERGDVLPRSEARMGGRECGVSAGFRYKWRDDRCRQCAGFPDGQRE